MRVPLKGNSDEGNQGKDQWEKCGPTGTFQNELSFKCCKRKVSGSLSWIHVGF